MGASLRPLPRPQNPKGPNTGLGVTPNGLFDTTGLVVSSGDTKISFLPLGSLVKDS
jgi:hypothetical protein